MIKGGSSRHQIVLCFAIGVDLGKFCQVKRRTGKPHAWLTKVSQMTERKENKVFGQTRIQLRSKNMLLCFFSTNERLKFWGKFMHAKETLV